MMMVQLFAAYSTRRKGLASHILLARRGVGVYLRARPECPDKKTLPLYRFLEPRH